MSRFTKDKNLNTSVSVINTKLATEQTLKQLVNLTGSDTQALEDIKTELETSNQQLEALETTLEAGNDNTSQANQKLDNIIEEAELLKRQEVENSTDYDYDIFSEVIVPQLPTPPPNQYIKDPFGRNSWYLQNVNAGATSLYWYSTDAPFGYKSNSVLTLGQIVEGGGFYFALYLDKVDASLSLPILGVYTTPTGSGDAFPSFYKSRVNYGIAGNQKLFSGELIVCYNSITILDKIKNVLPTARRVLLTQTTSDGTAGNDETIRYMSINNDSLTPLNDVRWSVVGAGWFDGSLSAPVLRHFRFTTSTEQSGEQQVNDAGTQTLITNTNLKLDTLNAKTINTSDISGNVNVSNQISGFSTESTLSNLNNKVVVCNTSDVSGNVNVSNQISGFSTESTLSNLNAKVLTCNTSDVSGNVNVSNQISGFSTESTLQTVNNTVAGVSIEVATTNSKIETTNTTLTATNVKLDLSNQKLDNIKDKLVVRQSGVQIYDLTNSLYNASQTINNLGNRCISISGMTTPTDIGAMIGGWNGSHPVSVNSGTGHIFNIASLDGNDSSPSGTGIRSVLVSGLNDNLEPQSEVVFLNGTTPVLTLLSYNHINQFIPHSAGPNGTTTNFISIRRNDNLSLAYGSISATQNSTGWFKSPLGFISILTGFNFTSASSTSTFLLVIQRNNNQNVFEVVGRYDALRDLNIVGHNICVLNQGDSLYAFQTTNIVAKCVLTFELIPTF